MKRFVTYRKCSQLLPRFVFGKKNIYSMIDSVISLKTLDKFLKYYLKKRADKLNGFSYQIVGGSQLPLQNSMLKKLL